MQKLIRLADGDRISLEITTPAKWQKEDPTVFLIHGLCGSHDSIYIRRMVNRLEPLGIRSIRFNMRGWGSGDGLSRRTFHIGQSEDVFECVKAVKSEWPESPITLIAYSLGGNLALKMAGELGSFACSFVDQIIAVCPCIDTYSSMLLFALPENKWYEQFFYGYLRSYIHSYCERYPDFPRFSLPKKMKLYEFDQHVTVPLHGFANPNDYHYKCSSIYVIDQIQVPCKILYSEDDPIIHAQLFHSLSLPNHVELYKTQKGGHMGFYGWAEGQKGIYWLDDTLEKWI